MIEKQYTWAGITPGEGRGVQTGLRRGALLVFVVLAYFVWTGFAPFNSEGLSRFQVANGSGDVTGENDGLAWTEVEAPTVFHTLSSRFGGGGVLAYMEFSHSAFSGLLLVDLRHAGLPDLARSTVSLPNRRRVEPFYQEWDAARDRFQSERVEGNFEIVDLFRGENVSAVAIKFDMVFFDNGADGEANTDDDRWRRIEGSATTIVTVDDAVERESDLVRARREADEPYNPDGDIVVDCTGAVVVEETTYQEDSYYYEDDDGGGCSGDTWKDDTEDPQDSGGCAGEEVSDDGQPNVDGGCADGGDEFEDPTEDDGSYYEDDTYEDDGCSGTDDSTDDDYEGDDYSDSSESEDEGVSCDSEPDDSGDEFEDDSFAQGGGLSYAGFGAPLSCGGSSFSGAPSMSRARAGYLRRYLAGIDKPRGERASKQTRRKRKKKKSPLRAVIRYLPFIMLGLWIRIWRRRIVHA